MKKKKNRFFLFCFSFLPGAGEMYFGLMKTGISLLGLFMAGIMLAGYTEIGVLACVPLATWIYSFFHANNMGALSDEEFSRLNDDYLFGFDGNYKISKTFFTEKYRKAAAIILIVLGTTMLWQTFCRVLRHIFGDDFYYEYIRRFTWIVGDDMPRVIVAFVIIWFGIKLIRGKKEELERLEDDREQKGTASGNRNGTMSDAAWGMSGAEKTMSGASGTGAGSAGSPKNDIPVERIEQVEIIDSTAENNGDAR